MGLACTGAQDRPLLLANSSRSVGLTLHSLNPHLRLLTGLPDLEMLSRKLERGKASLSDLCQLYRASSRLPLIEAVLRAHSGPHASILMER